MKARRTWLWVVAVVLFAWAMPDPAPAHVTKENPHQYLYRWLKPPPGLPRSPDYTQVDWIRGDKEDPDSHETKANRYLTGSWGGWRSRLEDAGLRVSIDYLSETAGNPVGGESQTVTYTQNFGVWLDFDLEKLVGWKGGRFHVSANDRVGTSLSAKAIGNVFAVQQIFGSQTVHLTTLLLEQELFGGDLNMVAGRINWGDDFAHSPLYCKFQNLGFCGNPLSLPINVNVPTYPNSAWGARGRVAIQERFKFLLGVYNSRAGFRAAKYHGVDFSIRSDSGVAVAWEFQYDPLLTKMKYPGHYKLGGFVDSRPSLDWISQERASAMTGVYLAFDQEIYRPGPPGTSPRANVFWTFTYGQPEMQTFQYFTSAALLYQGLFPMRPNDTAGLGFVWGGYSEDLRTSQRSLGQETQTYEMIVETNYEFDPFPWLQLQPSLQYVIRPSGYGSRAGAFVIAFQVNVTI